MPLYQVGKDRFYPTLGRWAYPPEVIELDEAVAENLMDNEPGLLMPVRHTTQAKPKVIRVRPPRIQRRKK